MTYPDNSELIRMAQLAKHNLQMIRPPQLQQTYVNNVNYNLERIIAELLRRKKLTDEGRR